MSFKLKRRIPIGATAIGVCSALMVGSFAYAPSANAFADPATLNLLMFSTPTVEYQQRALSTGASAEPLLNANLPRISGSTKFRATFGAAPGTSISRYQIRVCQSTIAAACSLPSAEIEQPEVTRTLNPGLVLNEDLDFDVDSDAMYGDIFRGQ